MEMDVRDEGSIRAGFESLALAYGGVDIVVPNAGIARSAPIPEMALADWSATMEVNATGYFLTMRAALRVMKAQGLGGSIVAIASRNATSPGKDFAAYSASKAAEVQLARVAAIEAAEYGVRVNAVNPDAVFEGSKLWSDEVRAQRARAHGVSPDKLEEFYAGRTLLKQTVSGEDVAEAVLFLASDRASKTTGAIFPVDSGIPAAFPR
jgi:NAD(P)-dependent dehydrogenase (short-subunit alcohol dehydrogenase family)